MCKKVGVVLVTYNRLTCLKNVIQGLDNQSYPIEKILVFDNNSEDGTIDYLKNNGFFEYDDFKNNKSKLFYQSQENIGGAGGFSEGVKLAQNLAVDYIWIMDDDVYPDEDCLKNLITNMEENKVDVAIPKRKGKGFQDKVCTKFILNNPFKYLSSQQKVLKRVSENKNYFVEDMSFEGPIISKELTLKVGEPNLGYFILFDDSDYARRLLEKSKILYVASAILNRQLELKSAGNGNQYNWKDYYYIRNNILFNRKYGMNWAVRNIGPYFLLLGQFYRALKRGNFENDFKIVLRAWIDGMRGIEGKTVHPNY